MSVCVCVSMHSCSEKTKPNELKGLTFLWTLSFSLLVCCSIYSPSSPGSYTAGTASQNELTAISTLMQGCVHSDCDTSKDVRYLLVFWILVRTYL